MDPEFFVSWKEKVVWKIRIWKARRPRVIIFYEL